MATKSITASPSTPIRQTDARPQPSPALNPPVGSWRHPRFEEIALRQQAATLDARKLRNAITGAGALIASYLLSNPLPQNIASTFALPPQFQGWPLLILRLYLLFTVFFSLAPLWQAKDDMSDIPLTPTQRQLLGLQPSSAPPTPGSAYVTPPRYTRSTSRNSSGGSRDAIFASSPLNRSTGVKSAAGSPLAARGSGSPFGLSGFGTSPASGSPLVRKAVAGRRWSAGVSGFRDSLRGSEGGAMDSFGEIKTDLQTSSPGGQRGASVALNSKWLYQRGKGSPGLAMY